MAKETFSVDQIDEQLFTELTPEQGSTVAGGFFSKKTYKIGNQTNKKIFFTFNASLKSVLPGQTNTNKSRLPRVLVGWDKDPNLLGFQPGAKLIGKGSYVFKIKNGLRELFKV